MVTPELLGSFSLFKLLAPDLLSQLAQHSSMRKFARRAIVLNAGMHEDSVCFLFEGRLQGVDFTIDGREVGLYFVEPGDFCGELGLFDNGPQPEYVIALTPSVAVFVPYETLREIALKSTSVVNMMGKKLTARVRHLTYQRSLLGLPNIAQRVCCQLWSLIPEKSKQLQSDAIISNPPTHMEIAIMLNLSRESVTRVFQTLQSRQIVKRDGPARMLITNVLTLKNFAEGKQDL